MAHLLPQGRARELPCISELLGGFGRRIPSAGRRRRRSGRPRSPRSRPWPVFLVIFHQQTRDAPDSSGIFGSLPTRIPRIASGMNSRICRPAGALGFLVSRFHGDFAPDGARICFHRPIICIGGLTNLSTIVTLACVRGEATVESRCGAVHYYFTCFHLVSANFSCFRFRPGRIP